MTTATINQMHETGLYCCREIAKRRIAAEPSVAATIAARWAGRGFGCVHLLSHQVSHNRDGMDYSMATLPDGSILDCWTPRDSGGPETIVEWFRDGSTT